uniref:Uncharacterized protein n=1 Tax=Anguilla anguilla TaxID=7936 RepID=A0A0E9QWG1_ANGAN
MSQSNSLYFKSTCTTELKCASDSPKRGHWD